MSSNFIVVYDELSQLNEELNEDHQAVSSQTQVLDEGRFQTVTSLHRRYKTLKGLLKQGNLTSDRREEVTKELEDIRQQLLDQRVEIDNDVLQYGTQGGAGIMGLCAVVAGIVGAVGPGFWLLAASAGIQLIVKVLFSILRRARAKAHLDTKINVAALVKQDPKILKEIEELEQEIGSTETHKLLTALESQLAKHPGALKISAPELEASRNRLTQIIQQTGTKKSKSVIEDINSTTANI
jgi:predicted RND superfamily exporter protein